MLISLSMLLCFALILSFFEEQLRTKDKLLLFVSMGVVMIMIAGLRTTDSTPDSEIYEEKLFNSGTGTVLEEADEPTFKFFASLLASMGLGVNALFFIYALIAVPLHMLAIWKLTKTPFMTLGIYLSYFYMMHELVQIRVGAGIAFFLWGVYYRTKGKNLISFLLVSIGALFHYSVTAGFIIFALSNKPFRQWEKWLYCGIIPLGLVAYFLNIDLSRLVPDFLGGEKLALYREMKEKGIEDNLTGYPLKFHLVIWMNFAMYFFAILYEDVYRKQIPQTTIFIKIQAVGFACLLFLNGISTVLAERLNGMFSTVNIFTWTALIYSFSPLIAGKIVNNIISAFRFVISFFFFALSWYYMHLV